MKYTQSHQQQQSFTPEFIWDFIEDHSAVKYAVYTGGAVFGIWLLSLVAKLLGVAVINFKFFQQAVTS